MLVVPGVRPARMPEAEPTVPAVRLLLLHVPPVESLVRAVAAPSQTYGAPEIAAGNAFMVSVRVL